MRKMIAHVCQRTSLSEHEAYMLCSLVGNLRVTQAVEGVEDYHRMRAKDQLRTLGLG